MGCSVRRALLLSFLVLAPPALAQVRAGAGNQQQIDPRRPRGIYAKVNIATEINQKLKANPSITPEQLNAYFDNLFQSLLDNPAISGLTLQVHWDTVNPNPPTAPKAFDWSYVDDAFDCANRTGINLLN
jgi:hypothetical protein